MKASDSEIWNVCDIQCVVDDGVSKLICIEFRQGQLNNVELI